MQAAEYEYVRWLGREEEKRMKILTVADRVIGALNGDSFDRELVREVDLIISCGDLPPEYLVFLKEKTGVPLFYVLGNHDIRYTSSPPQGCIPIHRRIVNCDGLRILGLDGSRWYNGGVNQYTEHAMSNFLLRLWFSLLRHRGVDILVTHAPPRWIGDAEDPCHRGFRCYRGFIDKYQPRYHLHGHIHAVFDSMEERISHRGDTRIINCYEYCIIDV